MREPHQGLRLVTSTPMRIVRERTAILLFTVFLASCNAAGDGAPSSADYHALEAILTDCQNHQSSIVPALEGSDRAVLLERLQNAQEVCTRAARTLEATPIPTINSPRAVAALDQMNAGLSEIAEGVKVMDRRPQAARSRAQSGMRTYIAGVNELAAANK